MGKTYRRNRRHWENFHKVNNIEFFSLILYGKTMLKSIFKNCQNREFDDLSSGYGSWKALVKTAYDYMDCVLFYCNRI